MTKEEIQKKTKEKVMAVETLCKQMELVVTAEQVLTQQGFLKNIVYYTDTQKYKLDEKKGGDVNDSPEELKKVLAKKEANKLNDEKNETKKSKK